MKASKILLFIVVSLMTLSSFAQGEDLKPFKSDENGKWGFINSKEEIVIEPKYNDAKPFSEGIAVVRSGDKYGMINSQGEFVIKPNYGFDIAYYNGYYVLDNEILGPNGITKAIGLKTLNGKSYFYGLKYLEGSDLAVVSEPDESGKKRNQYLMHLNGEVIGKLKYEFIDLDGFHDGLCKVGDRYRWRKNSEDPKYVYGFIDTEGKTIVKPKYFHANKFSEGLAVVSAGEGYGFIDTSGKWIIKPQYDEAYSFKNGAAFVVAPLGGKIGFIDREGNGIIPWFFDRNVFNKNFHLSTLGIFGGIVENDQAIISFKSKAKNCGFPNIPNFEQGGFLIIEKNGNTYYMNHFGDKYDLDGMLMVLSSKAKILWPFVPVIIHKQHFLLSSSIKSDSKVEYCKVYLNGIEVQEDSAPGGSAIVEDPKKKDNYNITVSRTLALREGSNTIKIRVKNAGGEKEEQKTIEYKPNNLAVVDASIVWGDIPTAITNQQLELDAAVKSTMEDVSCRVLLNGNEVPKTKGSSIVEDPKEIKYKYKFPMKRTLTLQEGANTIGIEVRDPKGELVKSEQKRVTYTKPALATIMWDEMPTTTDEKMLALKAQIKSDNPIEYYSILKDDNVQKKVVINATTKGSSIVEGSKKVKNDSNNVSINEIVELVEGDNVFVVEVKNEGGIMRTQPKTVRCKHKEKRIALVIGNQNYNDEKMRLTCPSNDANAVAARFRKLGFDEVMQMNNLNKDNMKSIINSFRSKSVNYDAVVVYYSGHGVQLNQINYMIPTDFDFSNGNVTNDCVAVTYILRDLGEDRMKIVVYDACRTQPRPKGDITDIDVMNNVNTFIAYASSVGQPSYEDIDSSYSIYTAAFLKVLEEPNLKLVEVFSRVNKIVRQKTTGMSEKQVPYIEGSIDKDFTFNKK